MEQKFPLNLPFLRRFAAYHLEGLLISHAKFFEKSATNSRRLKTIYEFLQKVADFSHSRCLPIEGTFSQTLYNLRIFVLINERMKYFSIFVAGFSCFHRLPIEEIFYRRTNLAFSIRCVSERHILKFARKTKTF